MGGSHVPPGPDQDGGGRPHRQGDRRTNRVVGVEIADGDISRKVVVRAEYGHVEAKAVGGGQGIAVIEAGIDELRQIQEGVHIGIVDNVFQGVEALDGRIRVTHDFI